MALKKRRPPIPSSYDHRTFPLKLLPKEPGRCHWCGVLIVNARGLINTRKNWCSKSCVTHYLMHADPKEWRREVYKRSMGICQADGCGLVFDFYSDAGWQADHILPLYMAGSDLSAWSPDNGQLLCTDCHKDKTRADYALYGPAPSKIERAHQRAVQQARFTEGL